MPHDALSILAYWIALMMFPVLFTSWGWRRVLIPFVWPCIKLLFKAIIFTWWFGFINVLFWTPLTYRTWGFTMIHLLYKIGGSPTEQYRFYREYEMNHTFSSVPEVNWRHWHNLPELPLDWQWSPDSTWHLLPTWTVALIPIGLSWVLYRRYRQKHPKPVTAIVVEHHGSPVG